MESSFFEYRNDTGDESNSDTEIIDNSYMDESFVPKKTPAKKNQTAFIPESDDDISGGSSCDNSAQKDLPKSVYQKSSVNQPLLISSSDDDTSKRGSIRQPNESSPTKLIVSSSEDEEQVSPEMVPRRRPRVNARKSSNSFIGRKTKRRIMLIDSDTDNSIVIEHNKNSKVKCLKDTPAKISYDKKKIIDLQNMSIQSDESDGNQSRDEKNDDSKCLEHLKRQGEGKNDSNANSEEENEKCDSSNETKQSSYEESEDCSRVQERTNISKEKVDKSKDNNIGDQTNEFDEGKPAEENVTSDIDRTNSRASSDQQIEETDDEKDEDMMVMSRATRMSIMGVIPKENDSDDSDFIKSDNSRCPSRSASETCLPGVTLQSPQNEKDDGDTDYNLIL